MEGSSKGVNYHSLNVAGCCWVMWSFNTCFVTLTWSKQFSHWQ